MSAKDEGPKGPVKAIARGAPADPPSPDAIARAWAKAVVRTGDEQEATIEPFTPGVDMNPAEPEYVIPRDQWGPGPWNDEPDRFQFETLVGYAGLIVRNGLGALCGYVAVPPGHPVHGKDWHEPPVDRLKAHGGVNFSRTGRSGLHYIGFDCCHAFDLKPAFYASMRAFLGDEEAAQFFAKVEVYRDMAYVREAIEFLAAQLKRLAAEEH